MYVVFKTIHYWDGAETKIIGVAESEEGAKRLVEEHGGKYTYTDTYSG